MRNLTMSGLLLRTLAWLLIALGPSTALYAADEPKLNVAVVEFSVLGEMHEQAGAIMADLMMSSIANSGRFTLKDRLSLSAVAKITKAQDQNLGYTGLLDPKTAAELGQRYGLDAVLIGAISKPGDLITVTARLIDTKSASLIRSGQIQGKDIDAILSQVNELAAMIIAPPAAAPTYALTVLTEPANANIRLLNHSSPYQPGMRLPPGSYELEITQAGYAPRHESLKITDRDATLKIALEPAKYALTVQAEPPDAQIRLLGTELTYKPGIALAPGEYQVEASKSGYATRTFPVRIAESAITVPIKLEKQAQKYRFTVQTDPPSASVKLLGNKATYKPGMELAPGNYTVQVSNPGYEPQQATVEIKDSDVSLPLQLVKIPEPVKPAQYRLTVQPDPPSASVKLLGNKATYKPGMELAPGNYTVQVSNPGYEPQQATLEIKDSDVSLPLQLVKIPEPVKPAQYRLTVQTDPPSASVKLLGSKATYKPGMTLKPGNYSLEVSKPGYDAQRLNVSIQNSDVTVPVTLVKQPEPELYRLTVRTDPPSANVKLLGSKATYKPGMTLKPGNYSLEVSKPGYDAQRLNVSIQNSDVTVPVTLVKQPEPELYRLTVRTEPANARVRLVNSSFTYRSGVQLPPGTYTVEASASGYKTQQTTVHISGNDASASLTLEQVAIAKPATPPSAPEPSAAPKRSGVWQIGSVQIDGSISGADRGEVQRILNRYVGQSATRSSLLDSAVQVYRSTGITLSFAVHNSASNAAVLSARVSKRERSSFESSVRMVTGSQLEQAGFGVSAD